MKPWRKLHSSILESERFMDVPLESKVLFFLLVAAQDDTGYYPWERLKVRRLVAACGWSEAQAKKHADALVAGEMATWEEGGIVLRNGAALNGQSRSDRQSFIYPRSTTDIPVTDTDIPVTALDKELELELDKREKPPISPLKGESFELPEFIDQDAWNAYMKLRKAKRAKVTDESRDMLVAQLTRFRDSGDDPNEILRRSVMNGWTGIFQPERSSGNGRSSQPGAGPQGDTGQGTYVPGSLTERTRRQNERIAAGKV